MKKTDCIVYYYYDDGRESYEFVPSFGRAMCAAFEFPPKDCWKTKIIAPSGRTQTYLLRGAA